MPDSLRSAWSAPANPTLTGGHPVGVLLIHGFTGSPAAMRPWAEDLNARGYGVRVPRLPGHGTTWQDLNKTTWADWYGEVAAACDKVRADHDSVVVCGLSMGGSLALRLAADRPDELAGLVLVNPAVHMLRKDVALLPVLKWVIPAFPGISNDIKLPGQDEGAYTKSPLKAAHSMLQAWAEVRRDLGRVSAPVQYFRSTVDHVVDDSSQEIIRSGVKGSVEWVDLPDSFHVATLDNDAPTIYERSAAFIKQVTNG